VGNCWSNRPTFLLFLSYCGLISLANGMCEVVVMGGERGLDWRASETCFIRYTHSFRNPSLTFLPFTNTQISRNESPSTFFMISVAVLTIAQIPPVGSLEIRISQL